MDNLDTTDTEYFTDTGGYDDTVWNDLLCKSSAGLTTGNPPIEPRNSALTNSQLYGFPPLSHRSLSRQTSARTGAPLVTRAPVDLPASPPGEVPSNLQTMSASELQERLLIPNYEKLIETLSQIIDYPNQDHFDLHQTREEEFTSIYKDEIMDKLRTIFGLESLRTNQARAVDAAMSGLDVLVLMPTGGGKSLCYQLPAACTTGKTKGVTFVVSPLKSLMVDQVRQPRNKGIDVVMFNSDQSPDATQQARDRLVTGRVKPSLVYVIPEQLAAGGMKRILNDLMRQGELARFVVDEAHCIPTWGRVFRPAYADLGFLRQSYPGVPIIALTATADANARHDIVTGLGMTGCVELVESFNRPNLYYEVRQKNSKEVIADIANFIREHCPADTGVIYCSPRNSSEEVAKELRDNYGINAGHYHAGMSADHRDTALEAWKSGDCQVIVAI